MRPPSDGRWHWTCGITATKHGAAEAFRPNLNGYEFVCPLECRVAKETAHWRPYEMMSRPDALRGETGPENPSGSAELDPDCRPTGASIKRQPGDGLPSAYTEFPVNRRDSRRSVGVAELWL